jgi:DNA-binding NarL/FixJ family response regulator
MMTTTLFRSSTRVIVIEMDPSIRLHYKNILQSTHDFVSVGDFCNTDEAIAKTSELNVDVALFGVGAPSFEAASCIKRLRYLLNNLKIIVIARTAEPNWVEFSISAGAEACLVKPVSVS